MASLLAKSLATNNSLMIRPAVMFRPHTVGSSYRFFSGNNFRLLDDSIHDFNYCKLKAPTACQPKVLDVVNEAFCPRISATRNMARVLNSMDDRVGVIAAPSGCPRWDVMQDTRALYIVRDMTGLPRKDEIFQEESFSIADSRVFGCVRVLYGTSSHVTLIVGTNGPDPGAAYEGYRATIWFPSDISTCHIKMGVMNEVLTIIIPKGIKRKWIHRITMRPDFFWPEMFCK